MSTTVVGGVDQLLRFLSVFPLLLAGVAVLSKVLVAHPSLH